MPGPPFVAVISYPIGSPELTGDLSAVLVSPMCAHSTSTRADAVALPSFDVPTCAVFSTAPQVATLVGEPICTRRLFPAERLVVGPPQVSVPAAM